MRASRLPRELRRRLVSSLLRAAPFTVRVDWDAWERPHYAYGTYLAALEAQALGLPAISVIEMGVACADGLVILEEIGRKVHRRTGVQVEVFGFDRVDGLPAPVDHRDIPYIWRPGQFTLDVTEAQRRVRAARLVLGDVADTVPLFAQDTSLPPVGFVAFDLDFYSSTAAAFGLFDAPYSRFLPRVLCYFDDVIGDDWELHSEHAGELLAISEFNQTHPDKKLSKIAGLAWKRPFRSAWNDQMYVLHAFNHPLYSQYARPDPAAVRGPWPAPVTRRPLRGGERQPAALQ